MLEHLTLLKVFVASPEDVKDERESVTKVVNEMNPFWEKQGVQVRVVKFETDVAPGVSDYPQAVINKDIGDNYDIFIGIMWMNFGSPTDVAGSGTEEEFNRAYDRYQENPDGLQIMFYFNKATPISLDKIDTRQLDLIREFKESLGEEGVLHWTYTGPDDFEQQVRMHLLNKITDWGVKWGTTDGTIESKEEILEVEDVVETNNFDDEIEEGFIDLIEIGNDNFNTSGESLNRISEAITIVGKNIKIKGDEFTQSQLPKPNMRQGKRILISIADEMEQFVERVNPEITVFSDKFSTGIDAYIRAAAIKEEDFNVENENPILDALQEVRNIKSSISFALESVQNLRDTVKNLPRISRDINLAKKHMVEVLDNLITEIKSSNNIALEAEKTLEKN